MHSKKGFISLTNANVHMVLTDDISALWQPAVGIQCKTYGTQEQLNLLQRLGSLL